MDELFAYLESLHPVSPEVRGTLFTQFHKETYRKRRALLSTGQTCDWFAFIERGTVKTLFELPGGRERILSFHRENEMVNAASSYITQQPSPVALVAVSDTIVRKIRRTELDHICERYPAFHIHVRKIYEQQLLSLDFHNRLLTLTAREALQQLISHHAWITQDARIKDYDIAEYLGIDKTTLSKYRHGK